MNISIDEFKHIIPQCREKETSGSPESRSIDNPSYRQCLVTALLANEFLGLDVYSEKVALASGYNGNHYFNKDSDGNTFRLCDEQFLYEPILTIYRTRKISALEEYKNHPDIKNRYAMLKQRLQTEIQKIDKTK